MYGTGSCRNSPMSNDGIAHEIADGFCARRWLYAQTSELDALQKGEISPADVGQRFVARADQGRFVAGADGGSSSDQWLTTRLSNVKAAVA